MGNHCKKNLKSIAVGLKIKRIDSLSGVIALDDVLSRCFFTTLRNGIYSVMRQLTARHIFILLAFFWFAEIRSKHKLNLVEEGCLYFRETFEEPEDLALMTHAASFSSFINLFVRQEDVYILAVHADTKL